MFWQQWRVNCLPFRSLAQNKNKNKNKKPAREHKINTPTHSHNKCKKFLNVENAPKHETDVFMYACKCICLSGECYPYATWNYNYTRTHLNRVPTFKKFFFFSCSRCCYLCFGCISFCFQPITQGKICTFLPPRKGCFNHVNRLDSKSIARY